MFIVRKLLLGCPNKNDEKVMSKTSFMAQSNFQPPYCDYLQSAMPV
jgi:hypothetical protein